MLMSIGFLLNLLVKITFKSDKMKIPEDKLLDLYYCFKQQGMVCYIVCKNDECSDSKFPTSVN